MSCKTCKNQPTCPNTGVKWCPSNDPVAPVVSVICLTYNQKNYIREAVESFLAQKTSFPFEILIHDDASTDGTTDIVTEYAAAHPDKIRLSLQPENTYSRTGGVYPYMNLYRIARGKYLAECDGDDYWTDPDKLQKQVEWLDAHPEDVLCYHENIILQRHGGKTRAKDKSHFKDYSGADLQSYDPYYSWPIHVSSRMFRNTYSAERDAEIERMVGDWQMIVYLSQFGGAKFLPDIGPSVYRRHGKNSWACQPRSEEKRRVADVIENITSYLADRAARISPPPQTDQPGGNVHAVKRSGTRPYCVLAPGFSESCGGGVVMHRLAQELAAHGCEVYMNTARQNPAWPALPAAAKIRGGIAVYPEQVYGNEMEGDVVVRYILHRPGNFGGPKTYPKTDLLFAYSEFWNREAALNLPPERILHVTNLDSAVFNNRKLPRHGCLRYRGKGRQPGNPHADAHPVVGPNVSGPDGQARLADQLNRCKRLFCYDNATAMVDIALLCGCPVTILPDPSIGQCDYLVPSLGDDMTHDEIAAAAVSALRAKEQILHEQLERFIDITQGAF